MTPPTPARPVTGWWAGLRRRVKGNSDRGSMTTELVIVAPVVLVILLLVVALGRYAHGKQLVEQAAAAAARAASLASTAGQAQDRALQAASASLGDAGVSCASMSAAVNTGSFRAGGIVSVTLTCTADLSGLALAGVPGSATMTATGAAPLETYRQFGESTSGSNS
ncbi:TadE/TadG family type IV pilus assembly protein [Nakamurella sp. GG22]